MPIINIHHAKGVVSREVKSPEEWTHWCFQQGGFWQGRPNEKPEASFIPWHQINLIEKVKQE
jgi:hypothetical protein